MTTTGPALPGSGVNNTGIGSVAWTNPGNATADDTSEAECSPGSLTVSNYLWLTGFDFSAIGDSDDIIAIQVEIIHRASVVNRINDNTVRLIVGGAVSGDNKAISGDWSNIEATYTYGDLTSDTWGLTGLVGTDVKTAFGVALAINGNSAAVGYVDYAQITIVHTASSGDISITLATAQIGVSGPSLTVTPGAAEIPLATGEVGLSGPSLTVDPGSPTVALNPGQIGLSGPTISVTPGAAAIALSVGQIGLSGPSLTIALINDIAIPLNVGKLKISSPGVTTPVFFVVLPTHHQGRSLSIHAYAPLATGNILVSDSLIDHTDAFTQTTRAFGGYWSGRMQFKADKNLINDWISNGLMRHIEIISPSLLTMGEFFVNRIIAQIGRVTITIGPAMNIVNKLWLAYSQQETTDGEPLLTGQQILTAVESSQSQARYGILERVVNGGTLSAAAAAQQQNVLLKKLPYPDHRETERQAADPTITLELLGYVHLLEAFLYLQTTNDGEENLATKLKAILGADPNSIFSTDYSKIADNTTQVPQYAADYQNALEQITTLVGLGDASLNRYLFGIYNNRQATYAAVPTAIAYRKSIDGHQYITPENQVVEAWELRPGQWLEYTDLMIGQAVPNDLTERAKSPKFPFLETVTFTMPDIITYTAGDINTASEVLAARYGLSKG